MTATQELFDAAKALSDLAGKVPQGNWEPGERCVFVADSDEAVVADATDGTGLHRHDGPALGAGLRGGARRVCRVQPLRRGAPAEPGAHRGPADPRHLQGRAVTQPSSEDLGYLASRVPLLVLTENLNALGASLNNPKDPKWKVYGAVSSEFYNRMAAHYATVSDEEAVAVLAMTMSESSTSKSSSAQIVADVVEAELRSRVPAASDLADAALDRAPIGDDSVGEYDHLQVLLDATGINS